MRWTASRWCRGLVGTLVLNLVLQGIWGAALGVVQAFPYRAGPPEGALGRLMAYQPPGLLDLLVPPARAQQSGPWRLSTPEADLNDPFLIEQATALGNDPAAIFAFVRDQIAFESYDGSLRGARGALWSHAGNGLDRASLLVGLLRISGFDARYVSGTLPVPDAQRLIASMFPNPTVILGCPPEDAERADPVNDPDLIAEASRHYWVEYGPTFTPLDPAFPESQPGDTFAAAVERFAEVPDVLRHKVTLRLKAELRSQLSGMMSYGGAFPIEPKTVLDHTFTAVELVGKPVSIGHFVNTWNHSAVVFNLTRYTYSPYLLIGQNDTDLSDDPIIRGTDYIEQVTNFPMGSQSLTGLKLEMDLVAPGGGSETHERWLLDKVGYDVRVNGGRAEIVGNSEEAAISPHDIATVYISGSLIGNAALDSHNSLVDSIAARSATVTGLLQDIDISNPDDSAIALQAQADLLVRQSMTSLAWSRILEFTLRADSMDRPIADAFYVRSYFSGPRIVIAQTFADVKASIPVNEPFALVRMDATRSKLKSILAPGQSESGRFAYNFARGVMASTAESLSGFAAEQSQNDPVGFHSLSAVSALSEAVTAGVDLILYMPENLQKVEAAFYSDSTKTRIARALQAEKAVLAPATMIEVNGEPRLAWFEIDLATGEVIDSSDQGDHFFEWAAFWKAHGSKVSAAVLGFSSGVLAAIPAVIYVARRDDIETRQQMKDAMADAMGVVAATVNATLSPMFAFDPAAAAIFLGTLDATMAFMTSYIYLVDPPAPGHLVTFGSSSELQGTSTSSAGVTASLILLCYLNSVALSERCGHSCGKWHKAL